MLRAFDFIGASLQPNGAGSRRAASPRSHGIEVAELGLSRPVCFLAPPALSLFLCPCACGRWPWLCGVPAQEGTSGPASLPVSHLPRHWDQTTQWEAHYRFFKAESHEGAMELEGSREMGGCGSSIWWVLCCLLVLIPLPQHALLDFISPPSALSP